MKKISVVLIAVLIGFGFAFTGSASAACGDVDPITNQVITCSNGPIVPQKANERFLKAGQEDCPWWFPSWFGNACVTTRAIGAPFIPLN